MRLAAWAVSEIIRVENQIPTVDIQVLTDRLRALGVNAVGLRVRRYDKPAALATLVDGLAGSGVCCSNGLYPEGVAP